MELIFFTLASMGLCFIVVHGDIFKPVRDGIDKLGWIKLSRLFSCPQCMGFYCGMLLGWLLDPVPDLRWWPVGIFACGFVASFACYFVNVIMDYLIAATADSGAVYIDDEDHN
jgi:hypothetical protein